MNDKELEKELVAVDARNAGRSAAQRWMFYCETPEVAFGYMSDTVPSLTKGRLRLITTWTGETLARVVHWVERQMSGAVGPHTRCYFTAVDLLGRRWHGQGPGPGMYVRMRLTSACRAGGAVRRSGVRREGATSVNDKKQEKA